MQIVINVPEEVFEVIKCDEACGLHELTRAIAKGIPLEDIKTEIDAELKEFNAISFYETNEHSKEAYYEIKQAISKIFDKYTGGKKRIRL